MWWRVTCHLLAIALQPQLGSSQTHCETEQKLVKVGTKEAGIPVKELAEGAIKRLACAEFFEGYVSFIEVSCLGGVLHADSSRCTPKGCEAGQKVPVRMGGINATLFAAVVRDLEHGQEAQVPCDTILDDYKEVVDLSCKFGKVQADAGKCRPAFKGASTVWRIVNGDFLPGTWRVFELSFYVGADCQSGKLLGSPVVSSEDQQAGGWKQLAFDRNMDTAWSAHCELGCQANTAWVGITLPQGSPNVRCVQLRQSQVRCCGTDTVRFQVWDGSEFQTMQVWDTREMQTSRGSFLLPVPITCVKGKPEGVGITHDGDGPPVVGRQRGETCVAQCKQGYYGTPTEFKCQPEGRFTGTMPSCYELKFWFRVSGVVSFWVTLIFLAWQYKFWCMNKKVRLNDEEAGIPKIMQGKWLEHGGRNIWQEILETLKNKEKRDQAVIGAAVNEDEIKEHEGLPAPSENIVHVVAHVSDESHIEVGNADELESMANMVMVHGRLKEIPPQTDGLCTPCEDPDLCWACIICPLCRIADTWHTLGTPSFLTYGRVFMMYLCCPCCWPCFNFYGRLRIRMIFGIPLEPHRDCLAHCCCCCCSPCAICQEARLVDAPTRLFWARKKQKEALDRAD